MRLTLPPAKDREAVVRAIDSALAPAISERCVYEVGWYVTDLYLQGVRNFTLLDHTTGKVEYFLDDRVFDEIDMVGQYQGVPFRWEDALTRIQVELGRLARIDTSPRVAKRKRSIQSLKEAALAQALLDEMVSRFDKRSIDIGFRIMATLYGTAGLGHWREELAGSLGFEWEVIPPWELLGIPGGMMSPGDLRAVARTRLVPLRQLEGGERFQKGLSDYGEEELEAQELPYGSGPMTRDVLAGQPSSIWGDATASAENKRKGSVDDRGHAERFVRLSEVFTMGPNGTVHRYLAKVGRALVADSDRDKKPLSAQKVPYPLGVGRYIDTGRFFGRSFASKVVPYCMRMEHLMEQLIHNVEDFDRFGYLIIPDDLGIQEEALKPKRGPKYVFASWDTMSVREPIQQITPINSSDMPGRVVQLLSEQADRLTSQGPMLQGLSVGRVDSGTAYDKLWEAGSTHLNTTAESFEMAYAAAYRAMLHQAKEMVETGRLEAVDLTRIEPTMIGLQIDQQTGTIRLKGETMPDPMRVRVGIESSDPAQRDRRRREAAEFLANGLLDPLDFVVMNYREDWGFPIGREDIWESYVKATLDCLVLFGDGQTPGVSTSNQFFDQPAVHKLAVDQFVRTAAFALASPEVRSAFEQKVNDLEALLGRALPQGMVTADQAAMNDTMRTQAQMAAQKEALKRQEQLRDQIIRSIGQQQRPTG